jgi:hypothetical protein
MCPANLELFSSIWCVMQHVLRGSLFQRARACERGALGMWADEPAFGCPRHGHSGVVSSPLCDSCTPSAPFGFSPSGAYSAEGLGCALLVWLQLRSAPLYDLFHPLCPRTSVDPDATLFLDTKSLRVFLLKLPAPLGMRDDDEPPPTAADIKAFICS